MAVRSTDIGSGRLLGFFIGDHYEIGIPAPFIFRFVMLECPHLGKRT